MQIELPNDCLVILRLFEAVRRGLEPRVVEFESWRGGFGVTGEDSTH